MSMKTIKKRTVGALPELWKRLNVPNGGRLFTVESWTIHTSGSNKLKNTGM